LQDSLKQSVNGNVSGIIFTSELIWSTVSSKPWKLNWKKNPNQPDNGFGNATLYIIELLVCIVFTIFASDFQTTGCGITLPGLFGSALSNLKSRLR
jgi:hypothetical protein